MISSKLLQQYQALLNGTPARVERSQVVMTGKDRQTFLHKFCTQDVLGRRPGEGGEAFLCSVQGKIVAYVYFFIGEEEIVLDTSPGQTEKIIAHLDRYVITEDVQFRDATGTRTTWMTLGPPVVELPMYGHARSSGDVIRHVPFGGSQCYFRETSETVAESNGLGLEAVEMLRIESASPLYGIDITLDNLPQEVGRDAEAINFKKGCYLGQETVARIDALGHVNKHLVQVKFGPEAVVSAGQELKLGEKIVGKVTSTAWSPRLEAPLALAYVRREHAEAGTKLEGAEVVRLAPPTI
jgi:folate-binding protein YgfZ